MDVAALSSPDARVAPVDAPSESPAQSLHDVAVFLVRSSHDDVPGLKSIRATVDQWAAEATASTLLRRLLAAAVGEIDGITRGETSDAAAAYATIGSLIEAAIEEAEDLKPASSRREATPPSTAASAPPPSSPPTSAPAPSSASQGASAASVAGDGPGTVETLPADTDTDLVADFITEGREYIEAAEAALLALETNPEDTEAVNTVFRAFHTIKGTSAFLGLKHVTDLAHWAESLLTRVRNHEIRFTGGYADLALRAIDMLKALLQVVQDALGGQPLTKPDEYDDLLHVLSNPEAVGVSAEADAVVLVPPRLGDILVAQGKAERQDVEAAALDQGKQPIGLAIVKSETASLTDVAQALRAQQQMVSPDRGVESSVRVRTARLDRLIDTVGELVIAESMVSQDDIVVKGGHYDFLKKVARTGKIVRELQDLTMSMRMIPFKATFQKMARLARDLTHKSGKLAEFVTEGEDTEIDRNMVDVLNDPLVHMVRNALDHGIEPPEVRRQCGKSPTGSLHLSAYHAGGNVVVELEDDGKGLDRERIVAKATATGLIESDKGLSDREVFNLIFQPGFSTAEKVTEVSGRGVGMDVVKRAIDSLRGRVDISSKPGLGSIFTIRLPLTMAITDGMLVKVGPQRYIIPTINIHLSFRPDCGALSTIYGRGEMVMLRGDLMPLIRLHRMFGISEAVEDPTAGLLVIVGEGDQRCALLVDELLGQQQVVAKSLGEGMGKVPGVSGGAILGDGRVGLILDAAALAGLARETTTTVEAAAAGIRPTAGEGWKACLTRGREQ